MRKFFTIIGGMGTSASMNFEKILNERTNAKNDQDYYNYLLVNHASVPDRSAYILDHNEKSFLPALADDIDQQNLLKPEFIALACNTAHYFYPELQAMTQIPILHMPFLVALEAVRRYPNQKSFGLLATRGTIHDHVYEICFKILGREVMLPNEELNDMVMEFIYENVKQDCELDRDFFNDILDRARKFFAFSPLILGCTELSYAADVLQITEDLLDSQSILIDRTLELAHAFRYEPEKVNQILADIKDCGDRKGLLQKISK